MAALAACATAAWVAAGLLEELPHLEDEFAYLWQAHVMAQGETSMPSPEEPASFLVPFVVDYGGQRFGKYPPGWPAALASGAGVGAPWLINPILAGLAVWLTYRLGERIGGSSIGLLAALLLACSPMFLMLSGSYLSHTFAIVLTLAFSLAWIELFVDRRTNVPAALLIVLIGLSAGLLFLTRPLTGVVIAIPFAMHGLWMLWQVPASRGWLLGCAAIGAGTALILLLWQWDLTGDPLLNPYTLWWPYDRYGFGSGRGVLPEGHSLRQAWFNTRHSLNAGMHDTFGWPYLSWLFFPIGLWRLCRSLPAWLVASSVPGLILTYAGYWIGAWLLGPRYYAEALPAFAVVSAVGVKQVAGWGCAGIARARKLGMTSAFALLMMVNLVGYLPVRLAGLHGLYGIRRDRVAPLEAAGLGEALVMVRSDHWTDYGNVLILNPPFQETGLRVALLRGTEADLRVLQQFDDRPHYLFEPDHPLLLLRMIADQP